MPLKPIFAKAPLTALHSLPLRAGQIRMDHETMKAVLALLMEELPAHPERWEAAVRLSVLLHDEAAQQASTDCVRAQLSRQQEDGSFPDAGVEASLQTVRAAWALYEQEPDRSLLEQMMRWCGYLASVWEEAMACTAIRVAPADLMALLCDLYRVTSRKAVLNLCEKLRRQGMDWSGVLHTFAVQRPMKRIAERKDLEAGMLAEEGNADGFYTPQYLTCHGETLADGARASLMSAVYSGNGRESTAARTGWEKISRWHGAVCGGLTADNTLAGASPSAAVATASAAAWAETFAAQVTEKASPWACDALETLMVNALPAAMNGAAVLDYQRVNSLKADCGTQGCYLPGSKEGHALARLGRGWASIASVAVTASPEGADVNLYLPGQFTMKVQDATVRLTLTGEDGAYVLHVATRKAVKAAVRLRIPAWTEDACIRVNEEGADEGRPGSYLTLEREWHNGDTVSISFARKLQVVEGYHQSAAILYGPQVMACQPGEDWALALCGEPSVHDGRVVAPLAPVQDWKSTGGVPVDMPVRPETCGEVFEATLVPYAAAPCRVAQFPRRKA